MIDLESLAFAPRVDIVAAGVLDDEVAEDIVLVMEW